ncbi:hypothetical protein A9Q02_22490 [Candidatus Chloroploca asiatica]|uniref:PPM-type phosphatase domain-containing protein n=2 Tax=Candidatus Chloroploca asiatica TaxID=1506545 RepID=A0A2H3KJX7_9CHLR|nr:hypothetical protein A9Q02_22490 [Candidatus Chloroploca asiatica]
MNPTEFRAKLDSPPATPMLTASTGDQAITHGDQTPDAQAVPEGEGDASTAIVEAKPLIKPTPRQWEEHEPIDRSYEVDHKDIRDLDGTRGWRITGASRRGKMHAHEAKYREDAWWAGVSRNKEWTIVAVADGGGSYDLSRVGADIAVKTSVEVLAMELPEGKEIRDSHIRGAMDTALSQTYQALEQKALEIANNIQRPITSRDLSTTLQLFAFCPDERKLTVAQVGDGLIALQKADASYVRLGAADVGEVAGATVFLNNVRGMQWNNRIWIYKLSELPCMIISMTDGVSDDVLDSEEQNIRILFNALNTFACEKIPAEAIYNWLGYDKRASFDDRTLVALYQGS